MASGMVAEDGGSGGVKCVLGVACSNYISL